MKTQTPPQTTNTSPLEQKPGAYGQSPGGDSADSSSVDGDHGDVFGVLEDGLRAKHEALLSAHKYEFAYAHALAKEESFPDAVKREEAENALWRDDDLAAAAALSDDDSLTNDVGMDAETRKKLSIERRRKRNREAMQRSRQRDKDHMEGLRRKATSLEKVHDDLVAQMNARLALGDKDQSELHHRLEDARKQAQELQRLNRHFQDQITDRMKGEDRMEGLLKELVKEQARQRDLFADLMNEDTTPRLSEDEAMELMMKARKTRLCLEKKEFPGVERADGFFGWEARHCCMGKFMYLWATKTFANRNAEVTANRAWQNAANLIKYRNDRESETETPSQRWQMVQRINEDTFLSSRDKPDPRRVGEFRRLYYLRFRVREPDGSFAVGTQTVRRRGVLGDEVEHLWANQVCLWTLFTPIKKCDERTGLEVEHCMVRFIGKSAIGNQAMARQNALETVLALARWEYVNVGPIMSLT